jgi:hypothetical protein
MTGAIIWGINQYNNNEKTAVIVQDSHWVVNKLNNLSQEREAEAQAQTKEILDNMSAEIAKTRTDAHTNRIILEEIIKHQNITVQLNDTGTGAISSFGLGKPKIIPSE